jgi:hypothetical protein
MTLALLFGTLVACSGDGTEPTDAPDTAEPTEPTGPTGVPATGETGTTETCAPSVEIGTGSLAFESLPDRIDMINGPQGGWHAVTAVRLCDLGSDATISFQAHRVADELEVGGSGTIQRILLPDGPCCYVAVDVYTYLLVPGYDRPADALHDQSVRLDVDVTLPGGEVWTDTAEVVLVDSTL